MPGEIAPRNPARKNTGAARRGAGGGGGGEEPGGKYILPRGEISAGRD